MICPKCLMEIDDDKAKFCANCGTEIQEINVKNSSSNRGKNQGTKKKVKKLKIILCTLLSIIVLLCLVFGVYKYIQSTPGYQLNHSYYLDAIDIYFESFQGTKKENDAILFLMNNLESPQDESIAFKDYPEFYKTCGTDVWNYKDKTNFEKFYRFIIEANTKQPTETTEKWYNYCSEVERISTQATSLEDIYVNPKDYYGKSIIVGGELVGCCSDIKRKTLTIWGESSNAYSGIEIYYGNLEASCMDVFNVIDGEAGIIVYGLTRKYNNSDDVYIEVEKINYLYDADLNSYNVTAASEQEGE